MTREVMQQAFDLIERLNKHGWILADFETEVYATLDSLKAALEQQPLPVQEPVAWVAVERGVWVSTRSADFRHIADGQYQLYAGPLQNDVFAAISTLKAIGYVYDNGKFCKEGEQWIAPTASQPPLPVQEPVAWDKPSDNFNEWWDSDRRRDSANPFTTDSFSYWAWEGWQAAQRPWVGLTEEDRCKFAAAQYGWEDLCLAVEAKLKEKNNAA